MTGYIISYFGHIVESKRLDGLPKMIQYDHIVAVDGFEGLRQATNEMMKEFIKYGGMIVLKDSNKPLEDTSETLDLRMFVPWSSISYLTTATKKITGDFVNLINDEMRLQ